MLVAVAGPVSAQQRAPYRDPSLPVERRVADLLGRMSPDEKFWQLFMLPGDRDDPSHDYRHGAFGLQVSARDSAPATAARAHAERIVALQRWFRDSTRLGIPIIPFDEALHGVMRPGATAFPQAIGLAASFDTALMHRVAGAIADETRSRGIRQVLSPVVNLSRDGRWGRTEETYGEDPVLASAMGVAFIRPFEARGIVTTPKHFVANVGDGGRDSWPVEPSERQLREVWFPPFEAAVRAGARSVMSAYNSVDGLPASQHGYLLTDVLRARWGFDGVVISDAAATGGAIVLHHTEADIASAARRALAAGLDVVFQTEWPQHRPWRDAIAGGAVPDSVVDRAVRRVLALKFRLGLFDEALDDPGRAAAANGAPGHLALAREAAVQSLVLLHNPRGVLPLASAVRRIALIGEDAAAARLGGYSGPGIAPVALREALGVALPATRITYHPGPGRTSEAWIVVPAEAFGDGVQREVFGEPRTAGRPVAVVRDARIEAHWTFVPPAPEVRTDWYAVRWTGRLTNAGDAPRQLAVEGDDGYRLWLDDELVLDAWTQVSHGRRVVARPIAPGASHRVRLEYRETSGEGKIRLVWSHDDARADEARIAEAVRAARGSEVAIVSVGLEEGEFRDRASLALPGAQEALVRAIAATGTPTVVVVVGGGPVTMPWLDEVAAVLMAWYPGEQGGHALADVLTGRRDPGGRLPITFPRDEGQLPLWYGHKPTGRGNDYHDLTGRPLFPFGFGLSYATFAFGPLELSSSRIGTGDSVVARVRITNTGGRPGRAVPQLYLRDELATVAQPVLVLRRFAPVDLAPGASRIVSFTLGPDDLALLDAELRRVVEPGAFQVMVGISSREIVARATLEVVDES